MIRHLLGASLHPVLLPRLVTRCMLVERPGGLVLVDAGLGIADLADPARLGRAWRASMRPELDPAGTVTGRLAELGYEPGDVTDVVLTHLDLDTAGGVADLPHTRVHVLSTELAAARRPEGKSHGRYLPVQWDAARLVAHEPPPPTDGADWFGLLSVPTVDDDVRLVPLPGHSPGHAGVAVRAGARPAGEERWVLHAGDAAFLRAELDDPPGRARRLGVLQRLLAEDDDARLATQARLRALITEHGDAVEVVCGHDPVELVT